MIRLGLLILAVFYLALPAMAQGIQVRSGEHADFSRLTLNLPERIGWSVVPSERGAHVLLDSDTLSIDPAMIFDRIPRDRLTDVQWNVERRRLELTFGCDCAVNGFWFGRSMLVLDISAREPVRADEPDLMGQRLVSAAPEPLPSRATGLLTPFAEIPSAVAPERALGENPAYDRAQLENTRLRLLQQIDRATSQGLLRPQHRLLVPSLDAGTDRLQPVAGYTPDGRALTVPEPPVNLRVNSRIDLDQLGAGRIVSAQDTALGCLSDDLVDVSAWGTDAGFGQQIGELHTRLVGEFDQVNEAVARQLAKLYLFFGFGAEARQVLELLPSGDMSVDLLFALSDIAEHGVTRQNSLLDGQLACDGVVAFWSTLSSEKLPQNAVMDEDAITMGFNALPGHLRQYYGPILSSRLLAAQRPEMATRILRILERGDGEGSAEAELSRAQTELARGETDPARERLEIVVERNVNASAIALIEMIESRIGQGEAVPYDQAQLVGAFAFERRNEAIAPELHIAHIRALAASGAHEEAHEVYADRMPDLDPHRLAGLQADLAGYLARQADDVTFLRLIFAGAFDHAEQPDPSVAIALAERMLGLGFPEEAAALISAERGGEGAASLARRLLLAETALVLGQPRQALVELLDLEGDRADLLRARALALAGDPAAAVALFKSAGAEDAARVAALLDGRWSESMGTEPWQVEPDPEMVISEVPGRADDIVAPPLATTRALLEASSGARDALSELLASYPEP